MTLKEMFEKVMTEYTEVFGTRCGHANPYFAKWHGHRADMIKEIMNNSGLDFHSTYVSDLKNGKVERLGAGIFTNVFGVSIRDQRIPSVSAGVYITYLFNSITQECYLTLAQGSAEYSHHGKKLRTRCNKLREVLKSELDSSGFDTTMPNTGNTSYDSGIIAHKKYTLATLPDDAGLYADLCTMEKIYRYYLDNIYPTEKTGLVSTLADSGMEETADVIEIAESDADEILSGSTGGYIFDDPTIKTGGKNLIIYGTPGCGKSYKLDADLSAIDESEKFRVTFHMDYTYTDFVGQILPNLKAGGGVEYEFIPGPFTLALKTAIANKDKYVALVIEEINRGNAASIFGDLFQLLDRDEKGTSQYTLTNKQITEYLEKEVGYTLNYIKIPANLSLYATMNTGDQNVFTLDTAFKRRWEFEKLSNIFNSGDTHKDLYIPGMSDVTWEKFVKAINEHMIGGGTLDSEDKQLGKYFVTKGQLVGYDEKNDSKTKKFAYKVLEYLWNDVAKFDRDRWFDTAQYKTLDEIIKKWCAHEGKEVFHKLISFDVSPAPKAHTPTVMTTDESGDAE